jgi:phosphohistidine phosphatase
MRHAKSDWSNAGQTDHQRSLNARGRKDTPRIAQKIKDYGILPDLILVSDAERTRETWQILSEILPSIPTRFSHDLYLASAQQITKTIEEVDPLIDTVLILAHNPGITDVFYSLAGVRIDNVPTAGVGCIQFDTDNFKNVLKSSTELEYFYYPKMD